MSFGDGPADGNEQMQRMAAGPAPACLTALAAWNGGLAAGCYVSATGALAVLGLALARQLEAAEDQEPLNEADGDSSDGAATEAHMI